MNVINILYKTNAQIYRMQILHDGTTNARTKIFMQCLSLLLVFPLWFLRKREEARRSENHVNDTIMICHYFHLYVHVQKFPSFSNASWMTYFLSSFTNTNCQIEISRTLAGFRCIVTTISPPPPSQHFCIQVKEINGVVNLRYLLNYLLSYYFNNKK